MQKTPTCCSAAPKSPCMPPSASSAERCATTLRLIRAAPRICRCSRNCAVRWNATNCGCTCSPRCPCMAKAAVLQKPWCAGSIRSAAWCRRWSSFPLPSKPGLCASSPCGCLRKWRNSLPSPLSRAGVCGCLSTCPRATCWTRTSATSWLPFWIATVYWHRRFAWRSPKAPSWTTPSAPKPCSTGCPSRASSYPSTTLARAIRRWRTSSGCRWTSSRSTSRL